MATLDHAADAAPSRPPSVLVTGGAGFIGASMVRALEVRGDRVRVLDDGRAAGLGALSGTRADIEASDLLTADLAASLDGINTVLHLCAQTSVASSVERPLDDLRQNVEGTARLLEAARRAGVERFVFASSGAVLGLAEPPAAEDALPRPANPYGASKLAGEAYLHAYHATYGMTTTSVRFANAYGPFSAHKRAVLPLFIGRLSRGEPLVIYGDGRQTRDLVHVDDLVRLVLLVLDAPSDRVAGRIFHGGSGRETTILELAHLLMAIDGRTVGIEHRPARPGDIARSALDITRSREDLGYEARVGLKEGLTSTVAWFKERGTGTDDEGDLLTD